MSRLVPTLYLTALAILTAAGVLLTARLGPADAVPAGVAEACATVPGDAVERLVAGGAAPPGEMTSVDEAVTPDGDARVGRWLDADGDLLVELRCARLTLADRVAQEEALAAARRGHRLTVLETDPEATLDVVRDGVIVRQADVSARLLRTWFVRGELTPAQAGELVTRTRQAYEDARP